MAASAHPFEPVGEEMRPVDANGFCPTCHEVATAWGNMLETLREERNRMAEALLLIEKTARWYADNPSRLAQEVDHALCVEILSYALDGRG